jgi:peptidoglycan/LPS O-acetylase OafA/YrhL
VTLSPVSEMTMQVPTERVGSSSDGTVSRWPQLDGLRGLSVLGVLAQHAFPPLGRSLPCAHVGVRLFFVLSGFLITGILIRARERVDAGEGGRLSEFARFQARRVARIFPAYYLVIVAGALFGVGPIQEAWPWLVSFTTNSYLIARGEWIDGYFHLWTLAIEAQFYLIWSVWVIFAPRRWLLPAVIVMLASAPLYRAWAIDLHLGTIALFCATPSCLDTLGSGALLAFLTRGGESSRPGWSSLARRVCVFGWGAVILLHLLRMRGLGWLNDAFLDSALVLACGGLVFLATRGIQGRFGRVLDSRWLQFIGKIGYGIYVYHVFLPALVLALLPRFCSKLGVEDPGPGPGVFAVILAGIVIVPVLSWYWLERPINRLAARVLGASQPGPVSDSPEGVVKHRREVEVGLETSASGPVAVTSDPNPGLES